MLISRVCGTRGSFLSAYIWKYPSLQLFLPLFQHLLFDTNRLFWPRRQWLVNFPCNLFEVNSLCSHFSTMRDFHVRQNKASLWHTCFRDPPDRSKQIQFLEIKGHTAPHMLWVLHQEYGLSSRLPPSQREAWSKSKLKHCKALTIFQSPNCWPKCAWLL